MSENWSYQENTPSLDDLPQSTIEPIEPKTLDDVKEIVTKLKQPPAKFSDQLFPIPYKQEETRAWLARRLVHIVSWTIAGTFVLIVMDKIIVAFGNNIDNQTSRELITLIWTSQATLVGSALGFYFGNQKSDQERSH